MSGRVDATGAGINGNWTGRNVLALTRFGGYSDTICVPANQVFVRPSGLSALEGAAIPVNYFTAWQLVVVMGGLKRDETVLVHSAGGGVGIAATQISKHLGARVIGTASAAKHADLRALEVDDLVDYRTDDFEARVRETPAAAASISFSMLSAVNFGRRDTAFWHRRVALACSAFLRRPVVRSATCLECWLCSRRRLGFSSIRYRS